MEGRIESYWLQSIKDGAHSVAHNYTAHSRIFVWVGLEDFLQAVDC